MKPNREIVTFAKNHSLRAFAHGYPYYTVRWHHHPEYEIHLVTATTGNCFIGDHVGRFAPGQLVMLGQHLPHNWISEVPKGSSVPERCVVVQFGAEFIHHLVESFPEMRDVDTLLKASGFGLQFSPQTAELAKPLMTKLCELDNGLSRARLFLELLELLVGDDRAKRLSGVAYNADEAEFDSENCIKGVLEYLRENYMLNVSEAELARLANKSPSAFSRLFRRTVGVPFVKYVNELRINAACELLTSGDLGVTDICYRVGFNSVSNFNRRFVAIKNMSPMAFRRSFVEGRQHWQMLSSRHAFYQHQVAPLDLLHTDGLQPVG